MSELAVVRTATRIGGPERRDLLTVANHPWLDELRREDTGWVLEMTAGETLRTGTLAELLCYAVPMLPLSPVRAIPRNDTDEARLVAVVSHPRFGAIRCDFSMPTERPDRWTVRLVEPDLEITRLRLDAALYAAEVELTARVRPSERGQMERLQRMEDWRMCRVRQDCTVMIEGEVFGLPARRPFSTLPGRSVQVRAVVDGTTITGLQFNLEGEIHGAPAYRPQAVAAAGGA